MNLRQGELRKLEDCYSEEEWITACDAITAVRRYTYPPDWGKKVILSGMMARIAARWGGDDKIHVHPS